MYPFVDLSEEDAQKLVIDAMVGSGATAEDVGKAIVQHSIMKSVGLPPEAAARQLLGAIRSGEDVSEDALAKALAGSGLSPEDTRKALIFQKALGALCGQGGAATPADVARSLQMQQALLAAGASPAVTASILNHIIKEGGGQIGRDLAEAVAAAARDGDLNYDDVVLGLQLDKALSGSNVADLTLLREVVASLGEKASPQAIAEAAKNWPNPSASTRQRRDRRRHFKKPWQN
jgi:hypothetical protein